MGGQLHGCWNDGNAPPPPPMLASSAAPPSPPPSAPPATPPVDDNIEISQTRNKSYSSVD